MVQKKLAQLFEENKEQLYNELQELYLPQDAQKLQNVIISFFDAQLSPSGEYGQSLTQAEMHLLNSCVKIWQTQFKLQNSLLSNSSPMLPTTTKKATKTKRFSKVESKNAVIGTLIGSGIGAFFNPIVTLAGALAGLCLTIYLTDKLYNENETEQSNNDESILSFERKTIDADLIVRIVKEMCENIDNIVLTFNIQVENLMPQIVEGFENQYPDILEAFQKFAGGMSEHKNNDETYIYNQYSLIEDALAQHGILVEHYNATETEKQLYFEVQETQKITDIKEILPALIKNGTVIKKGKLLIPKNETL